MLTAGHTVAGRYRIERVLGEGGMGVVYEATNLKLHKRVALKVLNEDAAPELVERFQKEAIAASSVKHPGIVVIYDADHEGGTPWIAMELLEGESLRGRMARGGLSTDEAIGLVEQVLDALAGVHAKGMVHRDIKPDNLFLERSSGRVKILDFGIAKITVDRIGSGTSTNVAMGTPHYLAPEQATNAKAVGPAADVYGVGVVLYEMLSGALPYEAASFGDLVRLMYTEGPRPLGELAPSVPPPLAALVDRCLRVKPEERPADAGALLDALRAARTPAVPKTVQLSADELRSQIEQAKPVRRKKKKKRKLEAARNAISEPRVLAPAEPAPDKRFEMIVIGSLAVLALIAIVLWIAFT